VETDKYLVVVEGVVLNNHDLMAQYHASSWFDCVIAMYEQEGNAFFNAFRGSFSGLFYDKHQNKWLIYTNHIGDKQVFVYKTADGYIFASEIGFIVDTAKLNKLPLTINETGAYMSLTFGFCIEDATLVQEITKLCAGHYFKLENGKLEDIQYHRFTNKPRQMTQQEAVEGIDKYFRQAIRRAFEKDKEYGYRHIACLSGGLDSRMTVWVAHEMGYTDQLNITYSESGYLDFSIAQEIATDLHHDWLFKPLDGGDCIREIDNVSSITYGSANFFGLAHGLSMEKLINYDDFGIIHTGQLGDVIIGTYLKKMQYGQLPKITDGAYSEELRERIESYKFKYDYEDAELFMMYNRGFCGIAQGLLTFQENSESYSPFTDVDFFEFCYSIPLELRFNHKIYFDWILDKYPQAAEYIWEGIGTKISRIENHKQRTMHILGYEVPHFSERAAFKRYLKGFILRRLGVQKKGAKRKTITLASKFNMSPIDYWYNTNPFLRNFMQSYWSANSHLLPSGQMGDDLKHLFEDCVLYDKLQAMSVLGAIKQLYK
jgi:asparagine synthase (glutamine-hydrolysing)